MQFENLPSNPHEVQHATYELISAAASKCEFEFSSVKTKTELLAETINTLKNRQGQDLFGIGSALIEAKKLLAHGEWLKFLRDQRVGFGARQAEKIMAIARAEDGIQLACHGVAKATLLLGLSLEQRTPLLASGAVDAMSVAKLRKHIKEMKPGSQAKMTKPKKKNASWFWAAGVLHVDPRDINAEVIESRYSSLANAFTVFAEHGVVAAGSFLINLSNAREILLREIEAESDTPNNSPETNKEI